MIWTLADIDLSSSLLNERVKEITLRPHFKADFQDEKS